MIDKSQDVVESFVRSSGPGGQNVNKVATCVALLHKPTGIIVKCQKFRTQFLNRQQAWIMLHEALQERQEHERLHRQARREKIRRQNRKHTFKKQNRKKLKSWE